MINDNHFVKITDNFFSQADKLKAEFDSAFASPLQTKEERFCWDYWYVKDQYKLLRTPADHFFSQDLFKDLQKQLINWGQNSLGCSSLSPMWLSYYIDGCEQQMHTDSPHGPWAFVYSITDWKGRSFSGGETFLLKPETLCYWDFFDLNKGAEKKQLLDTIEPLFNRLSTFDPRFPHGVQKVQGAHEPSKSRIVLHGWFTEPRPHFFNLTDADKGYEILEKTLPELNSKLAKLGQFHGLLSLEIKVSSDGKAYEQKVLCNTLIELNSPVDDDELIKLTKDFFAKTSFPKQNEKYRLVVPLLFK